MKGGRALALAPLVPPRPPGARAGGSAIHVWFACAAAAAAAPASSPCRRCCVGHPPPPFRPSPPSRPERACGAECAAAVIRQSETSPPLLLLLVLGALTGVDARTPASGRWGCRSLVACAGPTTPARDGWRRAHAAAACRLPLASVTWCDKREASVLPGVHQRHWRVRRRPRGLLARCEPACGCTRHHPWCARPAVPAAWSGRAFLSAWQPCLPRLACMCLGACPRAMRRWRQWPRGSACC